MRSDPTLEEYFATLTRTELTNLLMRRPATAFDASVRHIQDLAAVWESPWSMVESMVALPRPALELLETLAALVQGVTVEILSGKLEPTGTADEHRSHVLGALQLLQDHGLAWVGPNDDIWISQLIEEIMPRPLGLGPGVDSHVIRSNVETIKRILSAVGLSTGGRRDDVVRRLLDFYLDRDGIVDVVSSAPDETLQDLAHWATGHSPLSQTYDRANYSRVDASFRWGRDRGLLFGYYITDASMPAPVVMALRGTEFRAGFDPEPPHLALQNLPQQRVDTACGAAAIYWDSLAMSVFDAVAAQALPLLAKGGVGVRQLARLADRVKATPDETRLVLELGFAAELLQRRDSHLTTARTHQVWKAAESAERVAELIAAWWNLGHFPTASRTPGVKQQPALQATTRGGEDADLRHHGVRLLAELPSDGEDTTPSVTDRDAFAARLWWQYPMIIGDRTVVSQALWTEGHLLCVIAEGACSVVGRALLSGDGDALLAAVRAVLPTASTRGSFGSDLTVMVAGAPTAAAAQLLDECADRESRGQASLWRFSPASVRRAFDSGWSAVPLVEALRDIASTPLPQTLTYLIGDVERQHGRVRVASAGCCLLSDDTPLLTEMCAARSLRPLGLRMLAPTVALARTDLQTTMTALRSAGYLPRPEGDDIGIGIGIGPYPANRVSGEQPAHAAGSARAEAPKSLADLLRIADQPAAEQLRRQVGKIVQKLFREPGAPAPQPPTLFS